MAAMAASIAGFIPRGSLPDSISSRRKSGCLLPAHSKLSQLGICFEAPRGQSGRIFHTASGSWRL